MELMIKSRSEMGKTYSTYGGEESCVQGFGGEDPGIDGMFILRWIFRRWDWGA
jgi:hypothetical protein